MEHSHQKMMPAQGSRGRMFHLTLCKNQACKPTCRGASSRTDALDHGQQWQDFYRFYQTYNASGTYTFIIGIIILMLILRHNPHIISFNFMSQHSGFIAYIASKNQAWGACLRICAMTAARLDASGVCSEFQDFRV